MNMVRCMLLEKKIPKEFWLEDVNWTIHLLNRCPALAVKDKTPKEAWCGFNDRWITLECLDALDMCTTLIVKDRSLTMKVSGVFSWA
jgi:hypothetical protein